MTHERELGAGGQLRDRPSGRDPVTDVEDGQGSLGQHRESGLVPDPAGREREPWAQRRQTAPAGPAAAAARGAWRTWAASGRSRRARTRMRRRARRPAAADGGPDGRPLRSPRALSPDRHHPSTAPSSATTSARRRRATPAEVMDMPRSVTAPPRRRAGSNRPPGVPDYAAAPRRSLRSTKSMISGIPSKR